MVRQQEIITDYVHMMEWVAKRFTARKLELVSRVRISDLEKSWIYLFFQDGDKVL